MEGGEGDITVPIPVYLIEHPKGRALFDTGLHPDCQHDPTRAPCLGDRNAFIGCPVQDHRRHTDAVDQRLGSN
jgi:N-acyl homoserine lactone hydrolase